MPVKRSRRPVRKTELSYRLNKFFIDKDKTIDYPFTMASGLFHDPSSYKIINDSTNLRVYVSNFKPEVIGLFDPIRDRQKINEYILEIIYSEILQGGVDLINFIWAETSSSNKLQYSSLYKLIDGKYVEVDYYDYTKLVQ